LERVFQDFDNTNFRLNLKILIIDINKYFIWIMMYMKTLIYLL
jgi:hypothetical protein